MLDFPGVVDAEPVGEFNLIERLLKQPVLIALVPRARQLVLVENAEFHGRSTPLFAHDLFGKPEAVFPDRARVS